MFETEPRCDVCDTHCEATESGWCGVCGCCVEHCQDHKDCGNTDVIGSRAYHQMMMS